MNRVSREGKINSNPLNEQLKGGDKLELADPWAFVSGDRGLSENPWEGKYDRRKHSRTDNSLDFASS